jgi:hypothetical protein
VLLGQGLELFLVIQGYGVGAGGWEKCDAVLAAYDAVQGVGEDDMAVLVLANDQGGVEA